MDKSNSSDQSKFYTIENISKPKSQSKLPKLKILKPNNLLTFKINLSIKYHEICYNINDFNFPSKYFSIHIDHEYNENEIRENKIKYLAKYTTSELEVLKLELATDKVLNKLYLAMITKKNTIRCNHQGILKFILNFVFGKEYASDISVQFNKDITPNMLQKMINGETNDNFPDSLILTMK